MLLYDCKVESGWILAGLGSIFRRIGVYFSRIFERGFCKQSFDEKYALIVALNIACLLSHWFFSLTSGAAGCASRLELRPKCEKCDIEKHDVLYIDFFMGQAWFWGVFFNFFVMEIWSEPKNWIGKKAYETLAMATKSRVRVLKISQIS